MAQKIMGAELPDTEDGNGLNYTGIQGGTPSYHASCQDTNGGLHKLKPTIDVQELENDGNREGRLPLLEGHGGVKRSDGIEEDVFTPPDGGYGWVVVMAAFFAQIWIVGFIKCYSMMYIEIIAAFPLSSAYHASWIQAMLTTLGLLFAPIVGSLCKRYTTRKVTALGSLMCFTGLFISAFATSVTQLIFSMGVLTGTGVGFITTPGVLIVNSYFDKRRSIASAICVSGNAIGAFIMPPLVQYLMQEYELRGTLIIIAALQLQIAVSACLYRPPQDHARVQARQRKKKYMEKLSSFSAEDVSKISTQGEQKGAIGKINNIRKTNIFSLNYKETEHDKLDRELSMYRCLSLTTSVPNLKEYSQSTKYVMNSRAKFSDNKSNIDLSYYEFTLKDNEIPRNYDRTLFISKSGSCNEFSLPSRNTEGKSIQCISSNVQKLNNEQSLRKQASLRRFATAKSTIKKDSTQTLESTAISKEDTILRASFDVERSLGCRELRIGEQTNNNNNSDNGNQPSNGTYQRDKDSENVEETKQNKLSFCCVGLRSIFNPDVLRNPFMILISISSGLIALGAPHTLFYVHAHYSTINMDLNDVTQLLSVTSLVDLAGRLSMGYIADSRIIPISILYLCCAVLAGVSAFCVPLVTSYAGVAIVLSGFGIGIGGWVVLLPTMLARNLGTENLPASYGFIRMVMGVMNFVSPQLVGAIIDYTGNYWTAYFFMGSSMTLGAFLQLPHKCDRKANI